MKIQRLALIACLSTLALLSLWPHLASAQVTQDQVKRQLQEAYGVSILRIQIIENRGKSAFAVTMMNPPGNFNEAYQVSTIVIDRKTGKPMSQYFEETNGVHLAAPPVEQRTSPKTAVTP